jgi:hypothetical protein
MRVPMMPRNVALFLGRQEVSPSERNLTKVVEFFGIRFFWVPKHDERAVGTPSAGIACGAYSVLTSAMNLMETLERFGADIGELPPLLKLARSIYVHDFDESEVSKRLLRLLSGDSEAVITSKPTTRTRIYVTRGRPDICGPMSGLTVPDVIPGRQFTCKRGQAGDNYESLIATRDGDVLSTVFYRGVPIFLSPAAVTLDIDAPVTHGLFDIKTCFAVAVPATLYLRWAFRDVCWTSSEISASLIIDDPLLRPRYGSLVYRDLLANMARHQFSSTVAFIPWNWRRTNTATAELFCRHPGQLSLAVHGCDHTAGEFATSATGILNRKIKTALRRMDRHRLETGVPYAPIMIFPQGAFSVDAARLLKLNNFLAAVNTGATPHGRGVATPSISDLWNIAAMKSATFPIFTRRYISHGIENVAFDALLGKPCLVASHHDDFRGGSRELTEFISSINSLNCSVRWRSLRDALVRSFRTRPGRLGSKTVEMFAHLIILENVTDERQTAHVMKRESDPDRVRSVTHDQMRREWTHDGEWLRFDVTVPARATGCVRVEYSAADIDDAPVEGLGYRGKVLLRRWACEFRDQYVCGTSLSTLRGIGLSGLPRRPQSRVEA